MTAFYKYFLHFFILCSSVLLVVDAVGESVIVNLPDHGHIQGHQEYSDTGKPFYSFYGIPYAKPPTGSRRFMKPEPVGRWEGVAGGEIVECAQEETGRDQLFNFGSVSLRGAEDCLVTNIYTPTLDTGAGLAVMVFIHGGGYFAGSGSPDVYGPEFIMDHDHVILVTLNYRLGPLGFLSLGDDTLAGNQGLWDIVEAVTFIKNNCEVFGGDPEKITLVGHSAGAMAVQFLMLNMKISGLFRAAVLQSGPVISAYSCSDRHPAYYTRTLAAALGCDPLLNTSLVLQCLQTLPARDIIQHVRIVDQKPDVVKNAPNPWKPIMDGLFLPEAEAFVTGDPYELLKAGKFHDIPVIIGHTKDEGLYAVTEAISRDQDMPRIIFNEWIKKRGPGYLFGREEDAVSVEEEDIAAEYLDKFLNNGESDDPEVLQNMFGPSIWTAPTLQTAQLLSLGNQSPTYLYHYTHPGSLSLADLLSFPRWKLLLKLVAAKLNVDLFPNTLNASTHFDEIFIMFKCRSVPFLQKHTPGDRIISDRLLNLWINFVKHLTPVIKDQNDDNVWEPLNWNNNPRHLDISVDNFGMKDLRVFKETMDFFYKTYKKVPPTLHLMRSKSWKNPKLYAKYNPSTNHVEL